MCPIDTFHANFTKTITSLLLRVTLGSGELLYKITSTEILLALIFLEPSLTDLCSVSTGIYRLCSRSSLQPSEVVLWATFYGPEPKTQGGKGFTRSGTATQRHSQNRKLGPYFKTVFTRATIAMSTAFYFAKTWWL